MADRKVTFELIVDASKVRAAKQEMDKLADSTKKVGDANKAAVRASGGGFPVGPGVAGGAAGPMAGGRGGPSFFGGLAPLLGAGVVNQSLGGANSFLQANIGSPERLTLGRASFEASKRLPLVGNVVDTIATPYTAPLSAASDYAQRETSRDQLNRQIASGRAGIQSQFDQQRYAAGNAGIDAQFARAKAAAVAGGQFYTEDRFGVSNAATGQVRQAALEAEFDVGAAKSSQGLEELRLDRAKREAAEAGERVRQAQKAEYEHSERVRQSNSGYGPGGLRRSTNPEEQADLARRGIDLGGITANALDQQQRKLADLAEQEKRTKEATLNTAQKQYELEQRRLDVDKNRLQIVQNEKATLEGRARAFAEMDKGSQREAVDAARTLREKGFDALTPEQRSLVRDTQLYRDQSLAAGANNPLSQEFNRLVGDRQLEQATAEAKQLAADIISKQASVNAEFKAAVSTALDQSVKAVGDIVVQTLKNLEDRLRTEFNNGQRVNRAAEEAR